MAVSVAPYADDTAHDNRAVDAGMIYLVGRLAIEPGLECYTFILCLALIEKGYAFIVWDLANT